MEIADLDTLSSLQNRLSSLTGFSLAVYGEKGNVILPPVNEDRLLSAVKSIPKGSDEYAAFVKDNIEKAVLKNFVSVAKGPAGEHYFFVPLRLEKSVIIIAGSGAYLSIADFESFCKREGRLIYGLSFDQMTFRDAGIRIIDHTGLNNAARDICSMFDLVLRSGFKNSLNEKRYRLMKVIIGLVSDLDLDKQPDEFYDVLIEVIPFLFNVESIAVITRDRDIFKPRKTAGRLKDYLQSFPFKVTGILSELIEKRRPVYSESVMEILSLGLTDEITSVRAFPIISDERVVGILILFNPGILQEDADIIAEICRLSGFFFKLTELQKFYNKSLKEIEVLNIAASRLTPVKEPEMLYEAILDTSVHLAEAEKGSLMLINGDDSHLTIKAARGINKRLLSEIKIKVGEGIAGKVFQEGLPLMVNDIEKEGWGRRPKYKTGSFISMPLKTGEKTIGVLNISDKITGEVFLEEDLNLLNSFGSYACIALDRSAYYSLAGQLKELSITDALTRLFNRRYFEERFFEELHRSERHNLFFSLAMIDIDDFKIFNDSEGHLAGDEALRCIANIAKDCLRVSDVIARFGGEEFAVIMPQTVKEEALLVAERIRKSVKEQLPCSWKVFPQNNITVSIGVATFPSDGKDRKELLRNADKALYMAKMKGKDRTILWGS